MRASRDSVGWFVRANWTLRPSTVKTNPPRVTPFWGSLTLDSQLHRIVAPGQRNRTHANFTHLMRSKTDTHKSRLGRLVRTRQLDLAAINIVDARGTSQPSHSCLSPDSQLYRVVASGQRNRAHANFSHLMRSKTDTHKSRLGRLVRTRQLDLAAINRENKPAARYPALRLANS